LTILASKLMGQARQRFLWDQYYSFLRLFTFLRAIPVLLLGGKRLRFRVTPKSGSGRPHRSGLYPHLAVALVNVAVFTVLVATPLDRRLSTGTVVSVAACAAIVAATYLFVVARLWRRIYRRHHYRVEIELPARLILGQGSTELAAVTADVSFGGASVTLPEPVEVGSRGKVRLQGGRSPIALEGTVVSCRQVAGQYRAGFAFSGGSADDEMLLLFCVLEAALGQQLPAQQTSQPAGWRPRQVAATA
jgi:hypothetical protein